MKAIHYELKAGNDELKMEVKTTGKEIETAEDT